jgi:hypothetical protein
MKVLIPRHLDVEQKQVRIFRGEDTARRGSALSFEYLVAVFQDAPHPVTSGRVIVYDQYDFRFLVFDFGLPPLAIFDLGFRTGP